jgi:uncharacterized protein YgbK (DUF1537 family)
MNARACDTTWLVAVDDDPTGCQSVSGVPLLTAWDNDTLTAAARRRAPVTFVLTNSRSLPEGDAADVNREVGAALARVADTEGLRLRLISRSDSTLRGHFPAEVDALVAGAGQDPDGIVICPAFFEAGRFTADGIHWVHRNGELVPARDTEFAADATFGFTELTLADWTRHRGAPDDVIDIGLDELSSEDIDGITSKLRRAASGQAIIVNATNYAHLSVFDTAARRAEADGSTLVYRTGPSYVRAAADLGPPAIADLGPSDARARHGLVVVGSHTDLTNAQVAQALDTHSPHLVELDVHELLDPDRVEGHVADTTASAVELLTSRSVLLRTSRNLVTANDTRTPLEISRTIANAVTDTVRMIAATTTPTWVIAKGGITSHELLTNAFNVRTAEVAGQAFPGIIPVLDISIGNDRLPYVIFPGNVGDETTLARLLDRLEAPDPRLDR